LYLIKIDGSGNGDCAIVVFKDNRKVYSKVWRNIAKTNNEAEYSALISSLQYVKENNISENVEIYSDSQLACKQIKGEYSVKSPTLKPFYEKASGLLEKLKNVKLTWVKRNMVSEADQLMREENTGEIQETVYDNLQTVKTDSTKKKIEVVKIEKKGLNIVKIGLVQMDISQGNREANLSKIFSFLEEGKKLSYDLLLFPESTITGFPSSFNENMIEDPDNDYLTRIGDKCKELGICAGIGAFLKMGNSLYNGYIIFDSEGKIISEQFKESLFSLGNEDKGVSRGTERKIFEFMGIRVKVVICFELRFPELFFEYEDNIHPDLFIVPANWPTKRSDIWETLLKARAIENQSWVLGINRTSHRRMVYTGPSLAVSPQGEVVARIERQECIIPVILEKEEIHKFRKSFEILPERKMMYKKVRGI